MPGDIVYIASGDKVPADLRLLHARSLRIEEAALTGSRCRWTRAAVAPDAPLGDRCGMAYSGTSTPLVGTLRRCLGSAHYLYMMRSLEALDGKRQASCGNTRLAIYVPRR